MARKARRAVVSRNDGIILRRIAQAGGVIVTYHGNGVIYTLRANGERIRAEIVQRLINSRVLISESRGLFDAHPQCYRTRVPADGKL